MGAARFIGAEAIRAFAALALFLLALSHAPVSLAGTTTASPVGVLSYCGKAPAGQLGHVPCEACRIAGGADLPPPCGAVDHVSFPVAVYDVALPEAFPGLAPTEVRPEPRAPPTA